MTAATMNRTEIMAVRLFARFVPVISTTPSALGTTANVPATMDAKAATTKISVRYAKMQNSFFAVSSMFS